MRNSLTALALCTCMLPASAQTVPNGGFENWDSTFYTVDAPALYPYEWSWAEPNTPCWPANFLATSSPESHTGILSAKMESFWCIDDLGNYRLEEGRLYSGDGYQFPPRDWAFECMARPNYLNFFYKFHKEGFDSAYVRILLFNYDSITPGLPSILRRDTVGFASGYMHQEVTAFTPYSLPIQYLSADTPAFMHIYFSTSKTLAEGHGNTPPYLYAYPGTILWVDDVSVSEGTLGAEQTGRKISWATFPNPGHDRIWFNGPEYVGTISLRFFDARGVLAIDDRMPDARAGFDVGGLLPGLYSILIDPEQGQPMHVKWVKE